MELPILIMLNRETNALYGRHVLKIYVYKNIGHTTALLVRVDVLYPIIADTLRLSNIKMVISLLIGLPETFINVQIEAFS